MICNYWLLAFLPLAACSREGSSAPATREEPAMSSGRQPALRPDAAPVPPAPRPGAGPTPPARPRIPREDAQDFGVHLPAFSFRTMDDNPAQVQLNGEDLSTTPCLWSIPQHLKVTDAAVPRGWPPEGGRLVGKTRHPEDPSSEAEPCV